LGLRRDEIARYRWIGKLNDLQGNIHAAET